MALRKFVKPAVATASKGVHLFRKICRDVPTILTIYDLDISVAEARAVIKSKFMECDHVKDPDVVDILIHKAEVEYDEARLQWKTPAQLCAFFENSDYSAKVAENMKVTHPFDRIALDLD
mmetsp:Transcript_21965/g.70751  ORF Transcript_21965/g.70751 Transcript_21965/m.70751 type:complete len:120 (+) Transcript_21965:21-380(+)